MGKRSIILISFLRWNWKGCNEALRRIVPRIHMEQIEKLVNETPFITDLQKQFYKTMLWERKTRILDYSLQLL